MMQNCVERTEKRIKLYLLRIMILIIGNRIKISLQQELYTGQHYIFPKIPSCPQIVVYTDINISEKFQLLKQLSESYVMSTIVNSNSTLKGRCLINLNLRKNKKFNEEWISLSIEQTNQLVSDKIGLYSINTSYVVKTAVVNFPPFIILDVSQTLIKFKGFSGDVMDLILNAYNISQELVIAEDNEFGRFVNNTWTGLIGLLTNKKAHVGTTLTHSKLRGQYVKFSPYYISTSVSLLYRKIDVKTWDSTSLQKPFTANVWITIFLIVLIILVLREISGYRYKPTSSYLKLNFSSKIILLTFSFFSIIINASYTVRLTSLFAVVKNEVPFNSMEELVEKGEYFPIVLRSWSITDDLMTSTIEPWKSAWKLVEANKPQSIAEDIEDASNKVYTTKAAAMIRKVDILQLHSSNCSFKLSQKSEGMQTDSLAYANDFPYKQQFNIKLLQLRETGILSALENRYFNREENCPTKNFMAISITGISNLLILLSCGSIIAFMFLTIECICRWKLCC